MEKFLRGHGYCSLLYNQKVASLIEVEKTKHDQHEDVGFSGFISPSSFHDMGHFYGFLLAALFRPLVAVCCPKIHDATFKTHKLRKYIHFQWPYVIAVIPFHLLEHFYYPCTAMYFPGAKYICLMRLYVSIGFFFTNLAGIIHEICIIIIINNTYCELSG